MHLLGKPEDILCWKQPVFKMYHNHSLLTWVFLSRIIMRITSGIADMIVCSNEDDDDQSSVIVVMREALQFPELMS